MNVRIDSCLGYLLGLGAALVASGCGAGGGGGGDANPDISMAIESCSLGCTDSATNPGMLVSCGVTEVYVNQEVRIGFSGPVDLSSVNNLSFQVVEAGTGKTPPGSFAIDSSDPKLLVYRPQLTFDSAGNPIFGLTQGKSYLFKVPGERLDPLGPHIRNTTGFANSNRLLCTLVASRGVFDAKQGSPSVAVTLDVVTGYDAQGNPDSFAFNVPARGAENVYRLSPVRMRFNDVMNPASLANPVTGVSASIKFYVDSDGDTTDDSDQVELGGTFTLTIDQNALETSVVFQPGGGLPSAGHGPSPRKIVLELSGQIADLGGNTLTNPGTVVFEPEVIDFDELVITEAFDDTLLEDSVRTGSHWGSGVLAVGPGGGSGRLGGLVIEAGQVVELSTDSEDFSDIANPVTFNPANVIERPDPLVVTGGVFEFSNLRIDAGGVLRFRGLNPARVYVRGEAVLQGLIDLSGASGVLHESSLLPGGVGGTPGPNGGSGGDGGSRPDGSLFLSAGGVANPGVGPSDVLDPAKYNLVNGGDGVGIAFPSTIDPAPTFVANGRGGLAWPQPTPANLDLHMPQDPDDTEGLELDKYQECRSTAPGAPGSGAGHALIGGTGVVEFGGIVAVTVPPDTVRGSSDDLQIDDTVRSLSPELGLLRGGPGGGGGGAHLQRTQVNGQQLVNCDLSVPPGSPLQVSSYVAHSSAGGGGGGGGLQVAAGRRILLNGVIDASGGDGGSGTFPPSPSTPDDLAQAGGGGAGGSVLLQSEQIQIQAVPARIRINGGEGGLGTGSPFPVTASQGGDGSPGFLRYEAAVAPVIDVEASKVVPLESDLQEQYGSAASIEDLLSSAVWNPPVDAPSGWSGAQSCWIRPTGNFFTLQFVEDGLVPDPDCLADCQTPPAEPDCELKCTPVGWDMELRISGLAQPQSFRQRNELIPGTSLEDAFGSGFGSAPVVVRFQGARAVGTLIDPCSVPETGISSPLAVGSMTDWVDHPSDLNTFHSDPSQSPNVFRFVVLWDRSQAGADQIEGLESLTVRIQPD